LLNIRIHIIILRGDVDMIWVAGQEFIKKNLPLLNKNGRDESGLFIVEGEKFVSEIPRSWGVKYYIVSNKFRQTHSLAGFEARAGVYAVQDWQYEKLSDTVTPQGIMAVCEKKRVSLSDLLSARPLVLLCESLSDPGNVGTMIRTAAAAGASGVILTKGSADLYGPKVIRASAGAFFHINCVDGADALPAALFLKERHVVLSAGRLNGETSPYDADMTAASCIMIGNESHGLSPELSALADIRVKIPMNPAVESLNAAAAGIVLLYEAVRQRLKAPSQ